MGQINFLFFSPILELFQWLCRPNYFLENIISDDAIERRFRYKMPEEIRERFSKSEEVEFDIEKEGDKVASEGLKSSVVLDRSIDQHKKIVIENSDNFAEALTLLRLLDADIEDRVRRYCYQICKSTKNFRAWAEEDYKQKLRKSVTNFF